MGSKYAHNLVKSNEPETFHLDNSLKEENPHWLNLY